MNESIIKSLKPILESVNCLLHEQIAFEPTKTVWLSIDFRSLMMSAKVPASLADNAAYYIVQQVLKQIGTDGTVVVSAFNFDFPKAKCYNPAASPIHTGSFGELLRPSHHQHRTSHPIYSFFVFGKAERELLTQDIEHSTGDNSVFDWLVSHKTLLVTVGHNYTKALTVVHHAEHLAGVSYRNIKTFKGKILRGDQESMIRCTLYARDIDVCSFSSITLTGDLFIRNNNILMPTLARAERPILLHSVNLQTLCGILVDDLILGKHGFLDYYGPTRQNDQVITHETADQLYRVEFKKLASV
jgi:aminoglycoside 3-N-acetyltransferase